ncbi:MAG: hypothetical protein LBO21_07305 [Synergistaceae bacterium]|nr:hypothetical protein [Synergistaceae bacterium]
MFEGFKWWIQDKFDGVRRSAEREAEDPETEGERLGFERAAEEFEPVMRKMEDEYEGIARALSEKNDSLEQKVDYLVDKISKLESEKRGLKRKRSSACGSLGMPASYSAVPFGAMDSAGRQSPLIAPMGFLGAAYEQKRRRKDAELKGYEEAKTTIFPQRISDLRKRLAAVKKDNDQEIINIYLNLIETCLSEIGMLELQIAEIKLMSD